MLYFTLNRSCHRTLDRPSTEDAIANRTCTRIQASAPIRKAKSFIIVSNPNVISLVVCLLRLSGPVTILRAVVAVIITPFNLMFGRGFWTHIRVELDKRLAPLWAHLDPPTPVIMELGTVGILGSFNDTRPRLVFRTFRHVVSAVFSGLTSICSIALSSYMTIPTPTRLGVSGQTAMEDVDQSSALALAVPRALTTQTILGLRLTGLARSFSQHCQSVKLLSSQVYKYFRHGWIMAGSDYNWK